MKKDTDNLRLATMDDIPALQGLIAISATTLSVNDYTPEEVASLNSFVFGVDQTLIQDQSYFVIERNNLIIACGGWSQRAKLFAGDQAEGAKEILLDPTIDAAKLRAFFIHPVCARQGLATRLLKHCEAEALKHGFTKMELMSTLPGINFYKSQGFVGKQEAVHELQNGVKVKFLEMVKDPIMQPEIKVNVKPIFNSWLGFNRNTAILGSLAVAAVVVGVVCARSMGGRSMSNKPSL